jgi:murein DD-endopeptidase MepM/ murein hydrolase activator NlpD
MAYKFPDKKIIFPIFGDLENQKKSRWKRAGTFLRKRYRLVILNDATFAERFSLTMSPWGIIIGGAAITIVMTSLVISLIAFTPLREYIPGYGDVYERRLILRLSVTADSLEREIDARDTYYRDVLALLREKPETKSEKPARDTTGRIKKIDLNPGKHDLEFRKQYEQSKGGTEGSIANLKLSGLGEHVFFTPVSGYVTSRFSPNEDHFGVDIVTRQDEPIKSTLDGTVIFAGFSAEDGNVIHVQHSGNLISIYKHCSALLKGPNDRVRSGEAIAIVGNTGENSHGPHLHFELWFNGSPVNPQEFLAF